MNWGEASLAKFSDSIEQLGNKIEQIGHAPDGKGERLVNTTRGGAGQSAFHHNRSDSAFVVCDQDARSQMCYKLLKGRYFDALTGFGDGHDLASGDRVVEGARCILFGIQEERLFDTQYVMPIMERYPGVDLILTIPKGSRQQFADIQAYSDQLHLLERPFSMAALVQLVRQIVR